jgi:hypothetical protein
MIEFTRVLGNQLLAACLAISNLSYTVLTCRILSPLNGADKWHYPAAGSNGIDNGARNVLSIKFCADRSVQLNFKSKPAPISGGNLR